MHAFKRLVFWLLFHLICAVPATTIGFSFAGTCFSAISLNGPTDQNKTWAQRFSACDLFFCDLGTLITKKKQGLAIGSYLMLSMEPARFRQSNSRSKVTDASRDLGCDPWFIRHSRPPYQTGALASGGGVLRRGDLLRHVVIFNIRSQWQVLEILIFYQSILWKNRSRAKTPFCQVSSRSMCPFKGYRRNIDPLEAEIDSRNYLTCIC